MRARSLLAAAVGAAWIAVLVAGAVAAAQGGGGPDAPAARFHAPAVRAWARRLGRVRAIAVAGACRAAHARPAPRACRERDELLGVLALPEGASAAPTLEYASAPAEYRALGARPVRLCLSGDLFDALLGHRLVEGARADAPGIEDAATGAPRATLYTSHEACVRDTAPN